MPAPFDPAKRKMFPNVYDNIDKIQFDVLVKENYTATVNVVRNSAVWGDNVPPIMELNDLNYNDLCHASLSSRYIVDALVNGKYIQFLYVSDMLFMQKWLEAYIAEADSVDLPRVHPEYVAFVTNAKKALSMLDKNIMAYNDIQRNRNPAPPSVLDIISNL